MKRSWPAAEEQSKDAEAGKQDGGRFRDVDDPRIPRGSCLLRCQRPCFPGSWQGLAPTKGEMGADEHGEQCKSAGQVTEHGRRGADVGRGIGMPLADGTDVLTIRRSRPSRDGVGSHLTGDDRERHASNSSTPPPDGQKSCGAEEEKDTRWFRNDLEGQRGGDSSELA